MVNVDGPDVWRIGFIMQENASQFNLADHVVVYIPLSYAITGVIYFVPREKIRPVDIHSAEAMKFVVSGGVTDVDQAAATR
jgi:uncharacterized membrane protein